MPVFLFVLVVTGIIVLTIYFVTWWREKRIKPIDSEKHLNIEEDIIDFVYKESKKKKNIDANIKTRKISILEKLDITPTVLEGCLKELTSKRIATVDNNEVSLTEFGVEYYKVFMAKK